MRVLIYPNTIGHFEILPTLIYYLNYYHIIPIIYNFNNWITQDRINYLVDCELQFQLTIPLPQFHEYELVFVTTYYPNKFPFLDITTLSKEQNSRIFLITHEYHTKFDDNDILQNNQNLNLLWLAPHAYELACQHEELQSYYFLPIIFHQTNLSKSLFENEQKKQIRIVIQGNIQTKRRNYSILIKLLEKFREHNFCFIIIGRGKPEDIKMFEHQEKIKCFLNLDEKEFYEKVKSCHFIMPLIDDTYHHLYFTDKLTSSIPNAIGHSLPMIIHSKLASIYQITGQFEYNDETSLYETFESAINIEEQKYMNMKEKLINLRKSIIQRGLNDFKKIIHNTIMKW